jgi:3-methyladenine DNA glycosylase/8-oxoguanine DNA glycosylase
MPTLNADPLAAAVRHLATADARMAALIDRVGPCRLGAVAKEEAPSDRPAYKEDHYAGLVDAIVNQQLSPKAAATIFGRVRALGLNDQGRLDPAKLLEVPELRLREAGLSGSKASFIRDLSARVHRGELVLEAFEAQRDDDVIVELTQVKGIGRWTAEMFLIFRLGRLDVLPVGDLGVQKGFVRLFGLRKLPAPERMEKLSRPFRPYRSVACWYLWRLNEEKPAHKTVSSAR